MSNSTMDGCALKALECEEHFSGANESIKACFLHYCFQAPEGGFALSVALTAVYALIFAFGVLGNVCVCIVSRSSRWMQCTTSEYLVSLAVADLFNLVAGLPFDVLQVWQQYPWPLPAAFCHLKGWLAETTVNVSVLTIVAFAVERYLAICRQRAISTALPSSNVPLLRPRSLTTTHKGQRASLFGWQRSTTSLQIDNRHRNSNSVPPRVRGIVAATWAFGATCAIPYGVYHQVYTILDAKNWPLGDRYGPIEQTRMCMLPISFDEETYRLFRVIMHVSAAVFFLIPLFVIFVAYVRIGMTISRTRGSLRLFAEENGECKTASGGSTARTLEQRHQKALGILTAVVVAFFFCYAPYNCQRLLFFWLEKPQEFALLNEVSYISSGILFFLGNAVNPILYNLISSRFRNACRETLTCSGRRVQIELIIDDDDPFSIARNCSLRRQLTVSYQRRNQSVAVYGQYLAPPDVDQGKEFRTRIRTV